MTTQIYIKLVNFKCFIEFELILQEGLNFFVGDSGKGKTTVNKAIYFCLYGGRKFKNIQNRDMKDKPTMVLIHYQSPSFEWRITRTRPSESVQVELRDSNGTFLYKDASAQDWINRQFGVENIWLSASYIGVTKPHFLIGGTTNSDKLELLQRIAYGDSAPQNQPDTYLTAVKTAITFYNERFKQLNDNIRVSEGVKQSYQIKNPQLLSHPYITEEETYQLIFQRDKEKFEMERLRGIYTSLHSKKQFVLHINNLTRYNETIEDVKKRIETLENQLKKFKLKQQLLDFDSRIYNTDIDILSSDHFLFNRYISEGWNKINIEQFLDKNKEYLREYEEQLQLIKKNKEIELSNIKRKEINKSLLDNYKKLKSDYMNIMSEIESYNKRKEEIQKLKKTIGECLYTKLSDEDDMSSTFVYSIIEHNLDSIKIYKSLIKEGEKYNQCKNLIKEKFKTLVLPSKISEEDDLSINVINKYILKLTNTIDDCKNKIIESNRYKEISKLIFEKELNLIYPTKINENDDKSIKFINDYIVLLSNELNELMKVKKLIQERNEILLHLKKIKDDIDIIQCDKITDNDNMSYIYAQEYKVTLVLQLNELTCPHCKHGLLLDNGNLQLGTTKNNSENSKNERLDKIIIVENEMKKRFERDKLNLVIIEYDKTIKKLPNEDLEEVEKRILSINRIIEDSNIEYQRRNIFFELSNEILRYQTDLNNLTNFNIDELTVLISECKNKIELSNNEIYIRNSYNIQMGEINVLESELSTCVERPILNYYEEIKVSENNIKNAKIELEKRMKNDDYNNIISSFEKIIPHNIPTEPIEPEFLKMDELILLKEMVKPTLEIFDKPFYSYDDYLKLWKSNNLKELDFELKSILIDDYKGTLNELEIDIKNNINLEIEMKKVYDEKLRYETIIASLPEDDPDIENKITYLYNSINNLDMKINLANEMKEIKRIETCIIQMTSELNTTVEYLGHFNYYYSTTEELGMIALEQRINDINTPLKEILDSLFDEPISVKISPFKEMKNGNTKLQVNLVVEHKNALVDDYDDECSTGQIGRISIALLLAFARNNSNPFIIIDEVLSSVEPTRQTDILDILPSYSSGKFIINICHGIAEGNANNVIYFK